MLKWLEDRIGLKTSWKHFLSEPLPDRVGWPHVLGSILLALIGLQFLTGILLSFVYSSSPLGAYSSVRYLMQEMQGGAWLRSLHYWGASFIIVVLALHLLRTFWYAAYRRPREMTWIAGMLLMLCMLAFGQTGYLLPWDQRSYWGTTVTIKIVETTPLLGPFLGSLLRGGDAVGALTLSRFYSIHVVALPLITTLLVVAHLALVRRYGITAPWSKIGEEGTRQTPFYPGQMIKDATAILIVFVFLFWLASVLQAPLDAPADPTDTTFIPRPDWYFLFLFQSLEYFQGKWEVIGTFVLPTVILLLLFAIPFLDRYPRRELRYRPIAMIALVIALSVWGWLTYAAVSDKPQQRFGPPPEGMLPPRVERIKRPSDVGGLFVLKQHCFSCHSMTERGNRLNLQTLARNHFPTGSEWFVKHFAGHGKVETLDEKDVQELMSVLRLVAGDREDLLYRIPPKARFGAHFFYHSTCNMCHKIDGQGGEHPRVPAPDLTLRLWRSKQWHIKHIHDPQSVVKKSRMPPFFHYKDFEYDALAEYLQYLHR
jgi:ubiquinol-cytochrome c reductase cytochrome b subunit